MDLTNFKTVIRAEIGVVGRFASVGFAMNLLGFIAFVVFAELMQFPPGPVALTISLILLPFSFVANGRFSFKQNHTSVLKAGKFLITYLSIAIFNFLALEFVLGSWSLSPTIAQIGIFGLLLIMNFVAQRFWVFKV